MWLKLGDEFYDSPRVDAAGAAAAGALVRLLAYCARHLTDGHVPSHWATICAWGDQALIETLIDEGLVERRDGGYYLPTYLEWNPCRAELERMRAQGRKRAARSREARA